MSAAAAATLPWWWLREAECRALGIGAGARRSDGGVVFGEARAPLRIEVVAKAGDAPATVGDVSLRLWGDGASPRARLVLATAARFLVARRGSGFDPADPSLPIDPPRDAIGDRTGDAHGPTADERGTGERRSDAAGAQHVPQTIIDVPSVCERACVFCGISERPIAERSPRGSFAEVERAIAAAPGPVLFTGDDALGSPRIVELVRLAASRRAPVEVIGPPRRGLTASLAPRLADAGLGLWHTGIFGPNAALHDRIAGLDGAFEALVEAARAMQAAGIVVELLTPLIVEVLPALAETMAMAARIAPRAVTLMAYAPDSMVSARFDRGVARWDDLRAALATVEHARVHADGLPLCVLPASWLARGGGRFERTDEQLGVVHPDETCAGCARRTACPGIATTAHRAVGAVGLRAFG